VRSIDERHLSFEFDSTWDHIEKWDGSLLFTTGIHLVDGVDALDIVAFSHAKKECLLLEIKDFRDQNEQADRKASAPRRKPSRKRSDDMDPTEAQVAGKLAHQVALKVAGTVAGLVGAARVHGQPFAMELAKALAAHKSDGWKVRVVLWVEGQPTSKGMSPRSKVNLATLTGALKRQVNWLTHHPVQVLSTASPPTIPGLRVTDTRPSMR
jgi:hypothetical protein